ncbi:MAG: protein kinase domain-containing protein, partial [Hylemonella sp.]
LAGVADPRRTGLQHGILREFQTLSDMPPHPNVITLLAFLTKRLTRPIYDLLPDGFRLLVGGAANPVLALIMPLHPRTLEAAAAAGAEPAQLVRWCLDVSAAVAHMWQYRWVHLDLKRDNALVADDGRAVLTDMGTAMFVAADGSLTVPAHFGLSGNPAHRAPEVLAAWEAQHTPTSLVRMDVGRQEVWALGVLLHELVAGKHPYGEDYPGEGHDGAPVVDEAKLVARGLPAATVAVVRRMVSSDPGARPAHPAAAHAELV